MWGASNARFRTFAASQASPGAGIGKGVTPRNGGVGQGIGEDGCRARN